MASRTKRIPFFPLPLCVFPGETLPLHIFEDRYKALATYCLERDASGLPRMFGISYAADGGIREIGCAVMIERVVTRYDDGKLDLITSGQLRYRSHGVISEKEFPEIDAEYFDDIKEQVDPEQRDIAITLHLKLHELVKGKLPPHQFPERARVSFALAHDAGLDMDQRQDILQMQSENKRIRALIGYYRSVIPVIQQREDIKERVMLNGHFRKFPAADV